MPTSSLGSGLLSAHFSEARMAPYITASPSPVAADQLYRWHLEMSGALWELIAVVEVGLRNAIDRELRVWNANQPAFVGAHGQRTDPSEEWLAKPLGPLWELLNPRTRQGHRRSTGAAAKRQATDARSNRLSGHPRANSPILHDDLVASLTMGTWSKLLPDRTANPGRRYRLEQLWNEALSKSFPGAGPGPVAYWVHELHVVRNRIAHHEPVIYLDALSHHRKAARLLRSIDPWLGDWCAGTSRVPRNWSARPKWAPAPLK